MPTTVVLTGQWMGNSFPPSILCIQPLLVGLALTTTNLYSAIIIFIHQKVYTRAYQLLAVFRLKFLTKALL